MHQNGSDARTYTHLRNQSIFNPKIQNSYVQKASNTGFGTFTYKETHESELYYGRNQDFGKQEGSGYLTCRQGEGLQYGINLSTKRQGDLQITERDPIKQYKEELEKRMQEGKSEGIINGKDKGYFIPKPYRIPVMYTIPKIHKNSTNPPGRPIINGIDSLSSRLGQYIDRYLQPLEQNTKAYLNSKHILQIINGTSITICLQGMNNNSKNIALSWESSYKIHFLDLEIANKNNIITKTYFKTIYRNSYIPQNSCHHKP